MSGEEAAHALISALRQAEVPFMVVGSFSRNYYAFPRSTHDADIVVQCDPSDLERIFRLLPYDIQPDPQTSFEMVAGTLRNTLSVAGSDLKLAFCTLRSLA